MTKEDKKRLEEFKVNYAEYLAKDAGFSEPKIIFVRKVDIDLLLRLLDEDEQELFFRRQDSARIEFLQSHAWDEASDESNPSEKWQVWKVENLERKTCDVRAAIDYDILHIEEKPNAYYPNARNDK